jgi:glutamate--cysteine ligase
MPDAPDAVLTGPIDELEQRVLDSMPAIERWFRLEWMEHTPSFYSAVDVRSAGYKRAPAELDLYPGQWHQLRPDMIPLAVQGAMAAIEKICPEARNLMLIPDHRIQDLAYQQSLAQLLRIFHMAGFNVRVGSIDPGLTASRDAVLPDGQRFTVEPAEREGTRLKLKHFDPCTLLLNHDLSQGIPGIMEDLSGQYLLPPLHAAWAARQRSTHCQMYDDLAKRFAKLLGVDPWLLGAQFQTTALREVDTAASRQQLAAQVEDLLQKIKRKYREYGIDDKPFVLVKANQGRDIDGLLRVTDARDLEAPATLAPLAEMSRQATVASVPADQGLWLLQEGIHTQDATASLPAQPVVYMLDRYVVGGFYRDWPQGLDADSQTASGTAHPGLSFAPHIGANGKMVDPNRFYMVGVLARLAMLAGSYQLAMADPEAQLLD